jgi:UDP-GlcNAc:undecaprenyl-phosphate GlcNAc-1-phosphate transferase
MPDRSTLIATAVAVVAGVVATFIARAFARRFGVLDHPNPIVPQHTRPVAYLGGAGILLGLGLTFVAAAILERYGVLAQRGLPGIPWLVAIPAILFTAVGTADDLLRFSARRKLALQLAASTVAVWLGASFPFTGQPLADAGLSIVWFALVVNAFNLTDVCDGLAAGLACIAFVAVAAVEPRLAPISLVFGGVVVGFLAFNRPPATIYLGDGGSHLLGFLVGVTVLAAGAQRARWPFLASAILLIIVPVFELVFLVVVRARKGLPWWRGSPDHFSLRLQQAGLSRGATDMVAWGVAAVAAVIAVWLPRIPRPGQAGVLAAVVLALGFAWRALLRWEVRRDG